ncbi:MAG: phosphotransferase [Gammaproteobacteria bacterium]|nr:phosphotransferase [Gammaproteobacteria bacterium]|tara:strand:+ start:165 stop:1199 length:1035 start_codon:yes stop_codon:yes gene_type:complete
MNDGVHTLDIEKLSDYLTQQLDEFTGIKKSKKFNTGQSNPTYLLETAEKKYVLRKKPPGELLPSAHAVDREYRIIKALEETKVPVPRTVFLCNDESIIGTIFYVMEFVDGRIFWDPTLPEIDENKRMKVYEETVRIMAELHKIDVEKAGLLDFGKPGNYFERQVGRWIKQYRAAETESYPEVETLIAWLEKTMPDDDGLISIVHGDYRLYNMIFDHEEESMLALLDWELSTIGHPYADLAYQCMNWYIPQIGITPGLAGINLEKLGIPSEDDYVSNYCSKMGINSIPNWSFYLAFGFFRLAGIAQGVYKRSIQGNASADNAKELGAAVPILGKIALSIVGRDNA